VAILSKDLFYGLYLRSADPWLSGGGFGDRGHVPTLTLFHMPNVRSARSDTSHEPVQVFQVIPSLPLRSRDSASWPTICVVPWDMTPLTCSAGSSSDLWNPPL